MGDLELHLGRVRKALEKLVCSDPPSFWEEDGGSFIPRNLLVQAK